MKKILVPTDFSSQAENALKVAAQLAKKHKSEIHLLHILEMPLHKVDQSSSNSQLPQALFFMKIAHKKFEELCSKPYLKGLVLHEHAEFNEIFKGVFHVCKKENIDLVIMGSNGSTGFKEMLIGSNTEKIVRTSEAPVLVIKNEHKKFQIKNFVFASSFKDESKEPFKKAIRFAETIGAKIHLLMVNTPTNFIPTHEANSIMTTFANSFDFNKYEFHAYNDISIEKGIMNFSKSINADLIGMTTHGRQGVSHFFNGSVGEDLANHANQPVITFKI